MYSSVKAASKEKDPIFEMPVLQNESNETPIAGMDQGKLTDAGKTVGAIADAAKLAKGAKLANVANVASLAVDGATQLVGNSYTNEEKQANLSNRNAISDTVTNVIGTINPIAGLIDSGRKLGMEVAGKSRAADKYGELDNGAKGEAAAIGQGLFDPAGNLGLMLQSKEAKKNATFGDIALTTLTGGIWTPTRKYEIKAADKRRDEAAEIERNNQYMIDQYNSRANILKQQDFVNKQRTWNDAYSAGVGTNVLGYRPMALGGNIKEASDNEKITEINAGGLHEQNPNGGVPMGFDSNGTQNTVEEGEVKVDFGKKGGAYIFSNKLF
jgi:hypothetical protein